MTESIHSSEQRLKPGPKGHFTMIKRLISQRGKKPCVHASKKTPEANTNKTMRIDRATIIAESILLSQRWWQTNQKPVNI